jgi:CheY-like chemotaxis protein
MRSDPWVLLLVDDCAGDVRLTRSAIRHSDPSIQLHVVHDGIEAMRFLHQEGRLAGAPRPDLILLDLDLPLMDGRLVLAEIKHDESLKLIPAVILTASAAEDDVVQSDQEHANAYLTRPGTREGFEVLVQGIKKFWLTLARLPPEVPAR